MQEWDDIIDPAKATKRTYLRKLGDGEHVEHIAAGRWFYKYLPTAMKSSGYGLKLDDKVYVDYAQLLLPRAVGYSAALLDYFFRGNISIMPATNGITFRSIKLTAQNSTPNETMGVGEARLVIRYKALPETPLGGSKYLLNNPTEGTGIADYAYKVSAPLNVDLTTPQELTFDFSGDPLPYNFDEMTMQLVFKGKLGNEEGSVAVSKLSPIGEVYTNIALPLPSDGIYAKTSNIGSNATFNELRVTAQTDTPGGISGGVFSLVLEYRLATKDPFLSQPVATVPDNAVSYIIRASEKNGVNGLPENEPVELVFDLSSAPLPVWATDVYVNVVYSDPDTSKLLAIGYSDISEPTPVDIFNNADMICISDQWKNAGDPDVVALSFIYGIPPGIFDPYPHDVADIYYKISAATATDSVSESLFTFQSSGILFTNSYRRLGFVLSDYDIQHSNQVLWLKTDPNDDWYYPHFPQTYTHNGTAVRNQIEPDGTYIYPGMFTIRGNLMWAGAGIVYTNREYPAGSVCTWDALH